MSYYDQIKIDNYLVKVSNIDYKLINKQLLIPHHIHLKHSIQKSEK